MKVFISHAIGDRELANKLAAGIRDAGLLVWNLDSILPGDNWAAELGKALEESDIMVVLFTRGSQHSSTLKQDVQYALTSGNYRGRVVPVLVNMPTFQAGTDVPWILLRLDCLHVQGHPPDFAGVVNHLVELARAGCNVAS